MSNKDDLAYGYYPGQNQEQTDRAGEGGTRKLLGSALKTFRDKYDKYGSSSQQQQQSSSSQQNPNQNQYQQQQQQQYGSVRFCRLNFNHTSTKLLVRYLFY